ncbi:MAG: hypothetical protein NZ534_04780 [Bacteroidia bacterium]|nr:hypothetical protein [Bacteroidia bacterium]
MHRIAHPTPALDVDFRLGPQTIRFGHERFVLPVRRRTKVLTFPRDRIHKTRGELRLAETTANFAWQRGFVSAEPSAVCGDGTVRRVRNKVGRAQIIVDLSEVEI